MTEIFSLFTAFGPAGLQALAMVVVMYMMMKFFGERQDRIVEANERTATMISAAVDKNTEAVNLLRDEIIRGHK